MAKKKDFLNKAIHEPIHHTTSIGRRPSLQKMNKHKRRTFKLYRARDVNETHNYYTIIFNKYGRY